MSGAISTAGKAERVGLMESVLVLMAAIDTASVVERREVFDQCQKKAVDPTVMIRERWIYLEISKLIRRTLK